MTVRYVYDVGGYTLDSSTLDLSKDLMGYFLLKTLVELRRVDLKTS